MPSLIVNLDTHPYHKREFLPDGREVIPGLGAIRADVPSNSKFKHIGDPEKGPWISLLELPAGTEVRRHSHKVDRIEYLIEGEVVWREDGGQDITYGAGTLTHVTAGTFYQYRVLKDARILLCFAGRPGDSRASE